MVRLLLCGLCVAPALALVVSWQGESAKGYFVAVFAMLGLTPVAFRTFNNYTLELAERNDHPRYLSTLSLCIAIPTMVLSTGLGLIVDYADFEPVFIFVICCLISASILTVWLFEPRNGGSV